MQLFARLPHGFMRRLRAVLRLAIPTAVAADTARSCVVTYQLAQQRFQEWEEEDREATHQEMSALLRGVVRRCAAADPDFFPSFDLALEGGAGAEAHSSSSSSSSAHSSSGSNCAPLAAAAGSQASGDTLARDVWQLLGVLSASSSTSAAAAGSEQPQQQPGGASDAAASHVAAWAEQEAAQLMQFEQRQREVAAAAAQAGVVVVSLSDALSHVAEEVTALSLPWTTLLSPAPNRLVVTVGLSDVVSILGATPPARAAAHQGGRLQQRLMTAADGAAASARAALPWPQLALRRKSALRCAVEWHGWPQPPEEPLERELSHY